MRKKYVWDNQAAIDDFLNSQEIGHLSTINEEGWPDTVPVNYIWHGGCLYIHGGLGAKIDNIRRDSKASFVVTEAMGILTVDITSSPCHNTQLGRSVLLKGHLREVKNPDQKLRILEKFITKYDQTAARMLEDGHLTPEEISDQAAFHHCLLLELAVETQTGRQHFLNGKPEKYRKAVAAYFQHRGQELGSERDCRTALLIAQVLEDEK